MNYAREIRKLMDRDGFDIPYMGEDYETALKKVYNYIIWLKGDTDVSEEG